MELVKLITLLGFFLDNLMWPLVFAIYPLYASIRAIENNSLADSRKCLTYWVTCGLIMLFEIIFARLIEWLPFWSNIKLVVTVLLVAHHFEGAVYAYDHFIRPCFGINQHTICYWLRMEPGVTNSDKFVLLATNFVQENGAEALEKVFDKVNSVEQTHVIAENKLATSAKSKKMNPPKIILESSLVDTRHEANATTENRALEKANIAQIPEYQQSSIPNIAQKEWSAFCQLCTPNEVLLHNHLQGKKHKANEEKIKVSTHAQTNNKADEASKNQSIGEDRVTGGGCELPGLASLEDTIKDSSHSLCEVNSLGDASLLDPLQGKEHKAKDTEVSIKHVAVGNKTLPNFENMDTTKVTPKEGMSMRTDNKPVVGAKDGGCEYPALSTQDKTQKSWKCTICQIFAPNEIALQDHFQGRKHKAKKLERLAKANVANNKTTPSSDSKFTVKLKVTSKEGMSVRTENKPVVGAKGGDCESLASSAQDKTPKRRKCTICQIFASSEIALQDHFQGRKHKAKQLEHFSKATAANNKTTPSSDSKLCYVPQFPVPYFYDGETWLYR